MGFIRVSVVRDRSYGSSNGFQVYGDGGAGEIDFDHALTGRRIALWPDVVPCVGHVEQGHVASRHLDTFVPDGFGEGVHLLDRHLWPGSRLSFEAGPYVFGRFRHAVVMEDVLGNRSKDEAVIHETVVNDVPSAARALRPVWFDGVSGRLTFSFKSSEQLVG